jgi:glucan-binding YG repeat protein
MTGWVSVNGHWYYLNSSGAMETGWAFVDGYWYYLNSDGSMASSQWIGDYYVDASGKMV